MSRFKKEVTNEIYTVNHTVMKSVESIIQNLKQDILDSYFSFSPGQITNLEMAKQFNGLPVDGLDSVGNTPYVQQLEGFILKKISSPDFNLFIKNTLNLLTPEQAELFEQVMKGNNREMDAEDINSVKYHNIMNTGIMKPREGVHFERVDPEQIQSIIMDSLYHGRELLTKMLAELNKTLSVIETLGLVFAAIHNQKVFREAYKNQQMSQGISAEEINFAEFEENFKKDTEARLLTLRETIKDLIREKPCNIGWRNKLIFSLNYVYPGVIVIEDMPAFISSIFLAQLNEQLRKFTAINPGCLLSVLMGEMSSNRHPDFTKYLESADEHGITLLQRAIYDKLQSLYMNPNTFTLTVNEHLQRLKEIYNDYAQDEREWMRALSKMLSKPRNLHDNEVLKKIKANIEAHFVENQTNTDKLIELEKMLEHYFIFEKNKFPFAHLHPFDEIDTLEKAFNAYLESWYSKKLLGDFASSSLLELTELFSASLDNYKKNTRLFTHFFQDWYEGDRDKRRAQWEALAQDSAQKDLVLSDVLLGSLFNSIDPSTNHHNLSLWLSSIDTKKMKILLEDPTFHRLLGIRRFIKILNVISTECIDPGKIYEKLGSLLTINKFVSLMCNPNFLILFQNYFISLLQNETFIRLLHDRRFLSIFDNDRIASLIRDPELIALFISSDFLSLLYEKNLLKNDRFFETITKKNLLEWLKIKANFELFRKEIDVLGKDPSKHIPSLGLKPADLVYAKNAIFLSYDLINRIFLQAIMVSPKQWSEQFYNSLTSLLGFFDNECIHLGFVCDLTFSDKCYKLDKNLLRQIKYQAEQYSYEKILKQPALSRYITPPDIPESLFMPMQDETHHFGNFSLTLSLKREETQLQYLQQNCSLIKGIAQFKELLACIEPALQKMFLNLFSEKLKTEFLIHPSNYEILTSCLIALDPDCVKEFSTCIIKNMQRTGDKVMQFIQYLDKPAEEYYFEAQYVDYGNICLFLQTCLEEVDKLATFEEIFERLSFKPALQKNISVMIIEGCFKSPILDDLQDCINDMLEPLKEDNPANEDEEAIDFSESEEQEPSLEEVNNEEPTKKRKRSLSSSEDPAQPKRLKISGNGLFQAAREVIIEPAVSNNPTNAKFL